MTRDRVESLVRRAQKYLGTFDGQLRWEHNNSLGFSDRQNLIATVMVSCRLRKYSTIAEVVKLMANATVGGHGTK